jgi:hypothetical protein
MLPFDVTIPATVPQRSEITEGLMNYPVLRSRHDGAVTYTDDCVKVHILPGQISN